MSEKKDEKSEKKDEKFALPRGPFTTLPEDLSVIDDLFFSEVVAIADIKEYLKGECTIQWKSIGEKNGVSMYYAVDQYSSNHFFKGVGLIPVSVEKLAPQIRNIQNMLLIDPMCKSVGTVRTLDDFRHIYTAKFKMPTFTWHRDFCWLAIDIYKPDGTYASLGKSIVTSDCPPDPDHVRAEMNVCGYVAQKTNNPDEAKLTYLVQVNPKGWLPAWIVNYVAKSQAYNPGIIKELALKLAEQEKEKEKEKENATKTREREKRTIPDKQQGA